MGPRDAMSSGLLGTKGTSLAPEVAAMSSGGHCPGEGAGLRKGHFQEAVHSVGRLPVGAILLGPEEATVTRGAPLCSPRRPPRRKRHVLTHR